MPRKLTQEEKKPHKKENDGHKSAAKFFINNVDGREGSINKNAPHTFWNTRLGLNEYEYNQLQEGAKKAERNPTNYIRWLIIQGNRNSDSDSE